MPVEYDTSQHRPGIREDHFWLTATTTAINGFLMSSAKDFVLTWPTVLWIGFLNLYAIFLVVHRSASHCGKLKLPDRCKDKAQRDRTAGDKWAETGLNLRLTAQHLPFVLAEFGGALFYILLIVTSYAGVVSARLWTMRPA